MYIYIYRYKYLRIYIYTYIWRILLVYPMIAVHGRLDYNKHQQPNVVPNWMAGERHGESQMTISQSQTTFW